ncbi:MAG TPA: hypothetical protein VEW07_13325 [Solirubrobacterales bacterium]|nr:hypothetical protein [Solirubrobacterales bacterium]
MSDDRRCPDDGACHHGCLPVECFRVRSCSPLSEYGEAWTPEDQVRFGGATVNPTVEDILVAPANPSSTTRGAGDA